MDEKQEHMVEVQYQGLFHPGLWEAATAPTVAYRL